MKKTLILFSALALVLILAGCAKKSETSQSQPASNNQQSEGSSVISSIKDAIGMGKKMKCTYSVKVGTETDTYVTYVEGEKYKSESVFDGKTQFSVSDGKTIYSWNDKDKNGTKMDIKCIDDLKKPQEAEPSKTAEIPNSVTSPEEQSDNATDTKCESVSSIDFSVPTDITFKDQCEELKKMMESLDKLKSQMPSVPQGSIPNTEL